MGLSDEEKLRTLAALEASGGNISAAARDLGLPRKTVANRANGLKQSTRIIDDEGFYVRERSTLRDADGNVKLEWEKTALDKEHLKEMAEAMIAALVKGAPSCEPRPAPLTQIEDQLACYLLGDAHIGCYSWLEQTGADFDTYIAKRDIVNAARTLVRAAPASKHAMIVNLGDYFHADSQAGETPKSKNRLDTDTRWAQVIQVGVMVQVIMIDEALTKHETVEYVPVPGNHDPNAAVLFAQIIAAHYRNEPRVKVDLRPKSFRHFRFGRNLIGVCHGDGGKPEEYAGMLAVEAREDWGQCEFRYVWHGHLHHRRMIEKLQTIIECFRTLAARDQWHAHNGYLAGREMQQITLHKEFGEIGRCVASLRRIGGGDNGAQTSYEEVAV
jgi:transposase-like protein